MRVLRRLTPTVLQASAAAVLLLALLGAWTAVQGVRAHAHLRAATSALASARTEAAAGHLDRAAQQAQSAAVGAQDAQDELGGPTFDVLRLLPWVGRQVEAAQSLSGVARTLTRDGSDLLDAAARSPLTAAGSGTSVGFRDLAALSAQLAPVTGPLDRTARAVNAARATVGRLQDQSLVGPVQRAVETLAPTLAALDEQLAKAQGMTQLVARGAQSGRPMRLLFLAQDTWELRPSGGFIGSYGIFEIGNGRLRLVRYADATTLPAPRTAVRAPEPLGSSLQRPWALTSAGWWPDFPTSARTAQQLFSLSGGEKVDGVLASTQQFLEDLLRASGTSVTVPGYPDVITPDNISQRILYNVELKRPHDSPRKKFLGLLTTKLFDQLATVHGPQARAAMSAFGTAFRVRHLQIHLNDPVANGVFRRAGWTGELAAPASGDLFSLADTDFGTDKANQFVKKQTHYTVSRTAAGRLVAQVDVKTIDDGEKTAINPSYNSYLRIYAPPGATLVDAARHTTDIRTGTENGLVTFGASQVIAALSSKTRHFAYFLPESVVRHGVYHLHLRPQAGTPRDSITVTLRLGGAPSTRLIRSLDGDQDLSQRLVGAPRHGPTAPDAPWTVEPPQVMSSACVLTQAGRAPNTGATTPEQRRQTARASQVEMQSQIDALHAQGCERVAITYAKE